MINLWVSYQRVFTEQKFYRETGVKFHACSDVGSYRATLLIIEEKQKPHSRTILSGFWEEKAPLNK